MKYKILKTISLTLLDGNDYLIKPGDNIILESDGITIWVIQGNKKYESITTPNIINMCLDNKEIERYE